MTFTFSEAPVDFTAADITAVGGTVSRADRRQLIRWSTPRPSPRPTASPAPARFRSTAGSYTDATGNPGTGGSDNVSIDTLNPTVTVDIVDPSLSDSDNSSVVTFTFTEAPVDFTAADITAVGGTVSGLTGRPPIRWSTPRPSPRPTASPAPARFRSTAGSYTDATGNPGTGGSDNVAIDTLNPTVTVDIVDRDAERRRQQLGCDLHLQRGAGRFHGRRHHSRGRHGQPGWSSTADPLVYTATFTATDGFAGTGSVSVAAGSYTDAAGNPGSGGSDTVAIDTLNPTVTVDIVDRALSDGDNSSVVTFTFTEAPVDFTAADITAVGGTVSGLIGDRRSAGLHRDLHRDRRLLRHRLGFGRQPAVTPTRPATPAPAARIMSPSTR